MLRIKLSEYEIYNEYINKFTTYPSITIELEHSLVSLYKWEAKWHIPFLHFKDYTPEQYEDYIRCMILKLPDEPTFMMGLTPENFKEIQDYIANPMTATVTSTYSKNGVSSSKKSILTAEVIYSQMIANNIPFECQYWHLNQLTTLIKTCNIKNNPDKMPQNEAIQRNAEINAKRKAQYHTKG